MGPGLGKGSEMAFTNKSNPAKFTFSPKAMPPGKGGTCPGGGHVSATGPPGAPIWMMLNVSLQHSGPSSTGSFILMLTVRTTSAASGFSATYVPVSTNVPFPGPHLIAGRITRFFCRRRHQAKRPPLAKIRPGSPAPATGPGTKEKVAKPAVKPLGMESVLSNSGNIPSITNAGWFGNVLEKTALVMTSEA